MLGDLRVRLNSSSLEHNEHVLAEVDFSTRLYSAKNPRRWAIGLEQLADGNTRECWLVDSAVEDVQADGFQIANSRDWAWLGQEWNADTHDICALGEAMFLSLHRLAAELGKPHVARLWVIIPDIHQGHGDEERYKRFCVGRHAAYEQLGIVAPNYPAATVIGSYQGPIRLHVLLCSQAGTTLENPVQTSAYRYPREYGPCSPSFSRALRLDRHTFVSGTAAIKGSDSQHPGETIEQLRTIHNNLQALCGEDKTAWQDAAAYGRIYLRRITDAEAIRKESLRLWPKSEAWPVLHGDICREELLCEVETGL